MEGGPEKREGRIRAAVLNQTDGGSPYDIGQKRREKEENAYENKKGLYVN